VTNAQTSGPKTVTVNGNPGVQYEITGKVSNIDITYLHTTVETPQNFHQVLAYTAQGEFEKNRGEMEQVINSFQEAK
jgi:hypothetical protein